jgi:hypothetical protein
MRKNKLIKSQDGKLEVKYDNAENVCICMGMYALLLYLLIHNSDTIKKHTIYAFDEGVPQDIRDKLPSIFIRSRYPQTLKYKLLRKIIRLYTAIQRSIKYSFLKNATIYAQDGTFPAILIGKKDYFFLPECPNFFTIHANEGSPYIEKSIKKSKSMIGRIEKIILGAPVVLDFGNNSQCKKIYLTEKNKSPLLEGKELVVNSLKDLWSGSEEEKREFILDLFNVTKEDIALLGNKSIIFFSQPLVYDRILNESDYIELLKKVFAFYTPSELIIKTHPRDTFDYKKYFPEIEVFSKPVNMQLLSLVNLSFKTAVTIFSTAVYDLPESIEVDWVGADAHPNIKEYMGSNFTPPRTYNQMHL